MGYVTPADVDVSDNWQDHVNRNSFSPGTDYKTAYGTDCRMPASGVVVIANNGTNTNGDGRKLRLHCDDGRELDMLHASRITAWMPRSSTSRIEYTRTWALLSASRSSASS